MGICRVVRETRLDGNEKKAGDGDPCTRLRLLAEQLQN